MFPCLVLDFLKDQPKFSVAEASKESGPKQTPPAELCFGKQEAEERSSKPMQVFKTANHRA